MDLTAYAKAIKNWGRIMKLIAFFLLAACMHTSAATNAQTVTLHEKNARLENVFAEITRQTGYLFFYSENTMEKAAKVSIDVKNRAMEDVLKLCFKHQPLQYSLVDKTIIIKPKQTAVVPSADNIIDISNEPPLIDVKGRIVNEKGEPVAASIVVKGTKKGTVTNYNTGEFEIKGVDDNDVLVISGVSIETFEVKVNGRRELALSAKLKVTKEEEVRILSTGYQQMPKERATGSFVQVDNKLLNRSVANGILGRLEGIASGMAFYRNSSTDQPTINIRGRNTIFGNAAPLIVLDNFPYDGDINNINPNDIESITILRDAGAASIYGAMSANGVIVITTKKGATGRAPQVRFNTNYTIGQKPDLYYVPRLTSAEFIELEKVFFAKGWYTAQETGSAKQPLTPAVDLMVKKRDNPSMAAQIDQQIEALKQYDVRDDWEKYFLQQSTLLQNSLSVSGGGANSKYYFAVGYDKDRSYNVRNFNERISINAANSFTPFKNLDINTNLLFAITKNAANNPGINDFSSGQGRALYPYARLVDDNGNALPVVNRYRDEYKTLKESQGSLDMRNRPYDDLNLANNITRQMYNRYTISIRKTFSRSLNLEANYVYERQLRKQRNLMSVKSHAAREIINQYFNSNGTVGGSPTATIPGMPRFAIPVGDILDQTDNDQETHNGRLQLNLDKTAGKHNIVAIGGIEIKEATRKTLQNRLYGYDDQTATSLTVDYYNRYPTLPGGSAVTIAYPRTVTELLDRYFSYFANASYTYDKRYTFSASGRVDKTNYFGVKSNQRLVPLWSAGVKWNVLNEKFINLPVMDQLSFRATYGFNGNINKGATAYTTVRYGTDAYNAALSGTILSPENQNLKWEKIGMLNFGLDFALKNNRLYGFVEYFSKMGRGVIGDIIMDPTSGYSSYRGNLCDIAGRGIDIQLSSKVPIGKVVWTPTIMFSRATDKVLNYTKPITPQALTTQNTTDGIVPYNGYPAQSIFSYKWGGLDPATGDPMGYYLGQKTKSYSDIVAKSPLTELVYNGPLNPPVFGSFRNDIAWKNLALSVNITYKMGHYFRRTTLDYSYMVYFWYANPDFTKRWQKPGDELTTNVPSMPATAPAGTTTRDNFFYWYTEILVEKADHIRLQDIVLSYDLTKRTWRTMPFRNVNFYCNVNNVGILWRANKYGLDPDALPNSSAKFLPQPRTVTVGARFDF